MAETLLQLQPSEKKLRNYNDSSEYNLKSIFSVLKIAITFMMKMSFAVYFTVASVATSTTTKATPTTTKATPTTTKATPTTMTISTPVASASSQKAIQISTASLTTQQPIPALSKYFIFKLCFKEYIIHEKIV